MGRAMLLYGDKVLEAWILKLAWGEAWRDQFLFPPSSPFGDFDPPPPPPDLELLEREDLEDLDPEREE